MDQLRAALNWLKRHHFWVLSVLIALIALGCWLKAAGAMSKDFATNKQTIEGEFSSLRNLRGEPFHANDKINQRQGEEITKQSEDVKKLWQQLYDRQREGVLVWPSKLGPEFCDAVEKLQFGADIPQQLCERYQNYVELYFPEMPAKINARELPPDAMGGLGRGEFAGGRAELTPGMVTEDDGDYVCDWVDQGLVRKDLDFPQEPRPLRIWVTQENLWVYNTLLNVIAETNKAANASRKSNAAVRTVFSLEVGKRAAPFSRTPGRIFRPPTAAPSAAEPGMGEPLAPMGEQPGGMPEAGASEFGNPEAMGEMDMGGGPMSEDQEKNYLLNRRYLGIDGKPLPPTGIGASADAAAAPPPETTPPVDGTAVAASTPLAVDPSVFGVEYKRLPVRMVLEMDQRWLPTLIAQCASQPLQVEVHEVRVNAADALGTAMGSPGSSFRGAEGMGPGGGSVFQETAGLQFFPQQPNIVTVVIQGVIYIFNKPNPTILQTEPPQTASL